MRKYQVKGKATPRHQTAANRIVLNDIPISLWLRKTAPGMPCLANTAMIVDHWNTPCSNQIVHLLLWHIRMVNAPCMAGKIRWQCLLNQANDAWPPNITTCASHTPAKLSQGVDKCMQNCHGLFRIGSWRLHRSQPSSRKHARDWSQPQSHLAARRQARCNRRQR